MIYAVPINIKSQDELSQKHCFGDCGKIILAGLDLHDFGSSFICRMDVCPHEDKTAGPIGDLDGEEVMLRKLKETPVRAERLQEIACGDLRKEGAPHDLIKLNTDWFVGLWDSIQGVLI